jgi:drug/metabolite transporter (DMT)-like permease
LEIFNRWFFLFFLSDKKQFIQILELPQLIHVSILSAIFIIFSMSFYQLAIQLYLAAIVAVIFSFNPVFTYLFNFLIYHERVNRQVIISLIVSCSGMLIIIWQSHNIMLVGILLSISCSALFGLYSSLVKGYSQLNQTNSITTTSQVFLVGSFYFVLLHLIVRSVPIFSNSLFGGFINQSLVFNINFFNMISLLYAGLIVTAGGFVIYAVSMRLYPSSAHIIFFLKPAIAPIFALCILHESISVISLIGIFIILFGTIISLIKQPQNKIANN